LRLTVARSIDTGSLAGTRDRLAEIAALIRSRCGASQQ
jgi:hypothetical protein